MLKNILVVTVLYLYSNVALFAEKNEVVEVLISQKKQAMQFYKQKDYKSAYHIFSRLYLNALSDEKINFYLGRCSFELGLYETALASFERVEMLNPKNMRNKLEMARTQYELKMFEDAKLGFESVLSNPSIPDNVRANIELFVAKIDGKLQKTFMFASLKLGMFYDSNVNFASSSDTYNLPDYGTFSTSDSESDYGVDLQASLVHIYDIGQKNGFTLRNTLSIFNREYDTMNDFDMTYLSYNPALVYQDLKTTYELNFMFDHMLLHHESYLNSYTMMPNIIHKLNDTTRLIANVKMGRKNFKKAADRTKDTDAYGISIACQKLWSDSYVTVKLSADTERKLRGSRVDVDYNSYKLNVDYAKQLNTTLTLKANAELKTKEYEDYANLFKSYREDNGYRAGITLTKKITTSLYAEIGATYERTWSNQAVYSYDKTIYNISINKSF